MSCSPGEPHSNFTGDWRCLSLRKRGGRRAESAADQKQPSQAYSFTRYSARSSSSSSFAPLGRFNSWPRPDSIRYAVNAASAAPSAASFLSLSLTPFTAPIAPPAPPACAPSCFVLLRPPLLPSFFAPPFTPLSPPPPTLRP